MKKILFVLCLLSTAAAFAQNNIGANSLSNQTQVYQFQSHTEHAGYVPMSQERSVLAAASYTSAQGERRASDFPQAEGVSLGAFAREFRQQHAHVRKARVVWINQ